MTGVHVKKINTMAYITYENSGSRAQMVNKRKRSNEILEPHHIYVCWFNWSARDRNIKHINLSEIDTLAQK